MMSVSDPISTVCNAYEFVCPVCQHTNVFYRLKRDVCQTVEKEGDGHPLEYKWAAEGDFSELDPKLFFMATCENCRFSGELDDPKFRTSPRDPKAFLKGFSSAGLRLFVERNRQGEGAAVALGRKISSAAPLQSLVARFHLGIFSHCMRAKMEPGPLGRYYLRLGWVYRDQARFFPRESLADIGRNLEPLRQVWQDEVPAHRDYPVTPDLALNETEALNMSRAFFRSNFEHLRHASVEDEIRLRFLLAEIAFRLYELTGSEANFKTASSYYSGTMQKCLDVIGDKRIVGGGVSRARQLLETSGDRGRALRALRDGSTTKKKKTAKGKVAKGKNTNASSKVKGVKKAKMLAAAADAEPNQAQKNETLALKNRIAELETENRRWRELMGRDPLTGLPNKVSLFHIVIPKVLPKLETLGSFGFIGIGLENVSAANREHGWDVGDKLMRQAVRSLRHLVKPGEELFRLDGANFAIVGRMQRGDAGRRAEKMQERLAQAEVSTGAQTLNLAASMVVLVVEEQESPSAGETADAIHRALVQALYDAKKTEEGEILVFQQTHF